MSAYVVSDNHIHALVNYAVRNECDYRANGNRVRISLENAEEVGQILFDENYRSVHHRYEERTEEHFGKAGSYKFKRVQALPDAVTMLKLVNCYAYQTCETDNWEQSIAFAIVNDIKDTAIRKLPGYDAAPWGI